MKTATSLVWGTAFVVCTLSALAADRVALVIGNGTYLHSGRLDNPVNDGRDIAETLKACGFVLTGDGCATDLGYEAMSGKLQEFKTAAVQAKVALFFFAGHGLEVDGTNYLLPVDAKIEEKYQVKHRAMALDEVLDSMAGDNSLKIVILDCCRNNPLGRSWGRSGAGGLAAPASTPGGTILLYATAPGKTANDGAGRNSPFSAVLKEAIKTPGSNIETLFKKVGAQVKSNTKTQEPWMNSSYYGDFVFMPSGGVPAATPGAPAQPAWRQGSQAGDRLTVEVVPGVEMAFRWCPAGGFIMGSQASEKDVLRKAGRQDDFSSDETPHKVRLVHGFWLAETEVTQGQWQAVMRTSLLEQANKALTDDEIYRIAHKKQTIRDFYDSKPGQGGKMIGVEAERVAMYWVSWQEADDYCSRISRVVAAKGWGLVACLPSEAQWEYACRAGTSAMTYEGDFAIKSENNAPGLDPIAWYGGNSSRGYNGKGWDTTGWPDKQYPGGMAGPHLVGQKQPNEWGLQDMLGNVSEWCGDWYGTYPGGSVDDPPGPATGVWRVNRGGSWSAAAADCRAAIRVGCGPGYRDLNLGFRVALVPSG